MELIEKAIKRLGSQSAVARHLQISRQHMSMITLGQRPLQPIQAAKLAELIGERWSDHVLPTLAALEHKPEDRAFWLGKVAALRAAAAALLIVAAGMLQIDREPSPAFC